MAQSSYFNATCDPVDLTRCSQYYVDPCDCTHFYQCAKNQTSMYRRPCGNGTIYSHKTLVCEHPNDVICQTLRPWERCNVTESRMEQLRSMCFISTPNSNNTGNSTPNSNNTGKSTANSNNTENSTPNSNSTGENTPNSNNTGNSDQNTTGISVPLITQTILPTVLGVLVPLIIIGLVILRHRYNRYHESHLSDPYNPLYSIDTSIHEYCPYQTLRFNPVFDVDLGSSGSSSYLIVEELDSTPSPSTMPGACDHDLEYIARGFHNHMHTYTYDNRPHIEIVSNEDSFNSITGRSDTTPDPLSMPQPCEAGRPDPNMNSQEHKIASSEGSSYESIRGSCTTAMSQPSDVDQEFANKPVYSEDSADRSVPNGNSQEHEIASSGGSSYEYIRGSYTTAMSQPSDADQEFANTPVSSEDVVVQPSHPLFHPYISGNGPWPHKVIFSTNDHFLPPCTTFETT